MTIRLSLPPPEAELLAGRLFDALLQAGDLSQAGGPARLAPSRLYAYATGALPRDDAVDQAIAADPRAAADFAHLLRKTAPWRLPRLAAASPGEATVRTGENCRIELRRSEAEPSQVYVIIELAAPEAAPGRLFVARGDGRVLAADLPPARDGVVQLLTGADSPLVAALRDVAAEIYLR